MDQCANVVTLQLGEAQVIVPGELAARAYVEQVLARPWGELKSITVERQAGKIGEPWPDEGGAYAGIMRGDDGKPDYHLILLVDEDAQSITWDKAMAWATERTLDSHKDFSLPTRREQRLLWANLPEFFKPEYYWSCEQYASHAGSAWYQSFLDGFQDRYRKSLELRARAVRRLPID
jgi:hypothetical protein